MTLIVSFPGDTRTTIEEVGGKGWSLLEMARADLPVPPGVVLTTAFFAPWFDEILASPAWAAMTDATPERWPTLCAELETLCAALRPTAVQRQTLDDARARLSVAGHDGLLAVRSSSPEEDLASASFAGGYETRLGVRPDDLEDAVRVCFASSLDERVFVYKKQHGLDVRSPRIAVIVQRQIDSAVAGVGFSLNPLTNDYDEAVVDASWGLGKSVVDGLASPDHFVVDKVTGRIIERKLGAKHLSLWLDPDGGTRQREGYRSTEYALSDTQIHDLAESMVRIERLYERPMDIEWAYSDGRLHLLQARPVTTYVPLAPEMLTKPGERRRLYVDGGLSKGMTINAPISPLGLDWMRGFTASFLRDAAGIDLTPAAGLLFMAGGRMYLNLSNLLWLTSTRRLAKNSVYSDAVLSAILANVDVERYRAPARPRWMRLRMLWLVPKIAWMLRGFFWNTSWALLAPEHASRAYHRTVDAYEAELADGLPDDLALEEIQPRYAARMVRLMFGVTMAALTASLIGLGAAGRLAGRKTDETRELVACLGRGFTGNIVVEMGIALFDLARRSDPSELEDVPRLAERVETRRMPPAFLNAWDEFLARYGCRGPLEMDLASPRYADDPTIALRQMSYMAVDDAGFDPGAAHTHQVEARRRAGTALVERAGWLRRGLLKRALRLIELFAGARDTPKHHIVLLGHAIRKRALIEGERLVRAGRLDAADHVFDLTFGDLDAAARDAALDLRERRTERTRFLRELAARVSEFPQVVDSRGRILRPPPRDEAPGELSGMAVSPGVVRGPVKLLHEPHEKPVEKGDVLVAYATDPGWTPLFVNASAVVLEVGGVLQHGAVVAREYGKPCVVGIDRVMTRLRDGEIVEVDGAAGVVRRLRSTEP